jgi:hypothetical protein
MICISSRAVGCPGKFELVGIARELGKWSTADGKGKAPLSVGRMCLVELRF